MCLFVLQVKTLGLIMTTLNAGVYKWALNMIWFEMKNKDVLTVLPVCLSPGF